MKKDTKFKKGDKRLIGNKFALGNKPNQTSFKKGVHYSKDTEFKKGEMSEKQKGENNSGWKGGKPLCKECKKQLSRYESILCRSCRLKPSNHPMWKGGISMRIMKKNAPRPKPDKCEICNTLGSELVNGICFDHDHKTGKFRGWICSQCNTALGLAKDNVEILSSMIDYLNKSNEK